MPERKIFAPSDEVVFRGVWIGPDDDGDWLRHMGGVVLFDLNQVDQGRRAAQMVGGVLVPAVTIGAFMEAMGGKMRQQISAVPEVLRKMMERNITKMERLGR